MDVKAYRNSNLYFLSFIMLLLTLVPPVSSSDVPTIRPGCKHRCGYITVPYPFGMGYSCSMSDVYNIICNTSFSPAKPFLNANGRNLEVLGISGTEVRVRNSFTQFSCFGYEGTPASTYYRDTILNLNNTPFAVSYTKNQLYGVGCNIYDVQIWSAVVAPAEAKLLDVRRECQETCATQKHKENTSCSATGYMCCKTGVPTGLKVFAGGVGGVLRGGFKLPESNYCEFSLLAEAGHYTFRTVDLSMDGLRSNFSRAVIPVVLDWAVQTNESSCDESKRNKMTFACKANSFCLETKNIIPRYSEAAENDHVTYRCLCKKGFKGNPYLEPGCEDVNECEDNNPCEGICTNTIGAYKCSCPKGKTGDGRKDGSGCSNNPKFPLGLALGVGFSFVCLLVGVFLVYCCIRRRKMYQLKEKMYQLKEKFFVENGGLILRQQISSNERGELTKIFTLSELEKATDNYKESNILGQGANGVVYKGILPDKRVVAIKKSTKISQGQVEQFINEIVILAQVNHKNVVKLLGCCLETVVPLLVYEYVPGGTLSKHLHHKQGSGEMSSLTWERRLRIATEVASAIAYLHSAASPPVIHRDIKSNNILLDENFTAKVADFGASRLVPSEFTHVTTQFQGTLGYWDPEYFISGLLTDKSDVFSFGVVLVELLTGQKSICYQRPQEHRNLVPYFTDLVKEDDFFQLLDENVVSDGRSEEALQVAEIARKCILLKGGERPAMREVAADLQLLRRMESQNLQSESDDPCPDTLRDLLAESQNLQSESDDPYPITLRDLFSLSRCNSFDSMNIPR